MVESTKNVRWALDVSVSEFGSPFSDTSSSFTSTSSLQYINSQLVAHGFITSPGLSLEGISNANSERVAKCLLAMLSQRVNDMSQAEDLSTKLRTLSYDHERLMTIHRSATEQAANAEREMNVHKSRHATATRNLQSSESSHKLTTAELQRTRTSLQALRATHATELKKKEKDIERMVEKWSKLADCQTKLSMTSAGITIQGANAEVASGSEIVGRGKGLLEVALEHAESSRAELLDETTRLRRLILMSANRLQTMVHEIRMLASIKSDEPASLDHDALFPLTPINAADDKLLSLFASANDALAILKNNYQDATSEPRQGSKSVERESFQVVIEKLRTELGMSYDAKRLHEMHAAEKCALLNQVAAQGVPRTDADVSVDLMIAPERDAEQDRLYHIKEELADERQKFTVAAVKLGKEKAAFESERIKFLEEKRSWQVQQMLSELPPTPAPDAASPSSLSAHLPQAMKSSRKSPRKQKVVGKSSSSRKTRVSRRSSIFSIPPPTNVEPAYETEVIPIVGPVFEQQWKDPVTLAKSILPTSFVLPPPSPRTSLPPPPDTLLGPLDMESSPSSIPETFAEPIPTSTQPSLSKPAPPQTPPATRRVFPVAKPFAPHMTHAYSPVKPSPLSRILMLADSPNSPGSGPVCDSDKEDITPANPPVRGVKARRDEDDSPLREKRAERNLASQAQGGQADEKKQTSKQKAKSKAEPAALAMLSKPKTIGAAEKENRDKPRKGSPAMLGASLAKPSSNSGTSKPETSAKAATKLPSGKGGARRVPIGSAEAAPLPGWRG
ncbi:Afadin and alpha-actinin-binding-domain-containing protein [Melanogaster broomeanus]|nr:Afadin and alpha-actinin-binding-domain-containing protein [Melanogaster broomeanus]